MRRASIYQFLWAFQASISRRDLERYSQFLGLDPDQREAAELLLEGYRAEFDGLAQESREAMEGVREEFRQTRDPAVWRDIGPKMMAFAASRDRLEADLLVDIRELLTEAQAERWPRVEMMRRRDATLRRGLLSGESVDLVRVFEDLKAEPEVTEAVRPVLDRYEQELDRALIERNRVFQENRQKGAEALQVGDMAAVDGLFAQAREASERVRDINRQFARQVQAALPPELAERLGQEFQRRSFPRVYREGYAERAFEVAAGFEDITDEQRQSMSTVRKSFGRELAAQQARHAGEQEAAEANRTAADFMARGAGGRGGGPEGGGREAFRQARAERLALEDRFLNQLRAILTPEQAGRLPERRESSGARAR